MGIFSPLIGFLRRWFGRRADTGRAASGGGTTRSDERLEAHADLVATASHEIRTPLAGMLGMAELLAQTPLAPDQRSYVDAILGSGRALADLVDGLLDVARLDSGRLEAVERPVDMRALLQGIVEVLAPAAQRKGLEISCLVGPDIPSRVLGDSTRLRQVLLNLAGNAVKFTEKGGVWIFTKIEGERLIIGVEDTGPGIPRERRATIFQPFERATAAGDAAPGTGLGLAIARRLAQAMGGTVELADLQPPGAIFTVDLPLRPAFDDVAPSETAETFGLGDLSVLLVSELPFEALNLMAVLGQVGIRAARSPSVEIFYRTLDSSRRPDVLLVDAALGVDVARQIVVDARAAGVAHCLVLTSPFAGSRDVDLLAVFDGWLVKPVRASSLLARVRPPSLPAGEVWRPAQFPVPPPALAGLHILVAEDDPVNGRLAEARLECLGARVTRATDGTAAVSAVTAALAPGGTTFDAALLDLHMPVLDGFETTRRIRDLERMSGTAPMRIVALTASAQPRDRDAARAAGFDLVLMKPIEPGPLATALKRVPMAPRESALPGPPVGAEV